jgi:hypothetical protein
MECDEECAEEECFDPDRCGAEDRPPKPEQLWCGIDTRPLLPIALAISTVIGALVMMLVQLPLLCRKFGGLSESTATVGFLLLYGITLGCMTYCAFADPGQLGKSRDAYLDGLGSEQLPRRAYKSWQYRRPVRRYDHYCRWLSNSIGLLNHREFFTMLIGLVTIGFVGIVVDFVLAVSMEQKGFWNDEVLIIMHLCYSVALLALAFPILRIHLGLISRNEMAAEWKRNEFYIAKTSKRGNDVPVNDLSDEEFNSLFDKFVYDKKRNSFDRGCFKNCFTFWCIPRWSKEQIGEF